MIDHFVLDLDNVEESLFLLALTKFKTMMKGRCKERREKRRGKEEVPDSTYRWQSA